MPSKAEKLLGDAIKTGRFDAVYCLCGDNEFRKDEAVRQIVNRATEESTRDFNVEQLRGAEVDAHSLEANLGTLPMVAERRVVVLRDPGALKRQARAVLDRYLENPSPSTVLVLVVPAGGDPSQEIIDCASTFEIDTLTGARLTKWIVRQAKTSHGVEIDADAAELLQEGVGPDLMELAGEIDKLASYCDGQRIDAAAVSAVVGVRRGETIVDLLEAVSRRDSTAAVSLTPLVLRQPKMTGVSVVMALTVQTLGIGLCRARRDTGANASAVERAVFPHARRNSFAVYPAPGPATALWARAAARWSLADVGVALDALLAADTALKETRVASDEEIVSTAVLAACAGAERAAVAA
jgi:DNA polymerase III subunit delta